MKILNSKYKINKNNEVLNVIGLYEDQSLKIKDLEVEIINHIKKYVLKNNFDFKFKSKFYFNINKTEFLIIGLGKKKDFDNEKLRRISGFIIKKITKLNSKTTILKLPLLEDKILSSQIITEGLILGSYKFDKFKTEKQKNNLEEINIIEGSEKGIKKGKILAESSIYVRDLVNSPPNELKPEILKKEAEKIAKKYNFKIKILDKKSLEKYNMNGILAVGNGSLNKPYLIVIQTNPNYKKSISIVGKGITFDSGGLDLKPEQYITDMKSDMAGAATVLGILKTIGELKLKTNFIGVLAIAENMPGSSAFKPGDIIKTYSGKTIEIKNTDAEGRVVLADAVAYAETFNPQNIITIATLTGSCIYALGYNIAALISNNKELKNKILVSSKNTDELVWELPINEEFRKSVESEIADFTNLGKKTTGAGTITAAAFIEKFITKTAWAHIDIAGTAWLEEANDYKPKGATGFGVRLLTNLLENY